MRFALFFLVLATSVHAGNYHFVSINYLTEQEVGRIVIPQIYSRLGLSITITPLPGKRAEFEATTGLKDGEIMRIYEYGVQNPSMLRVETPYYSLDTMVFVRKDSGIVINDVADMQGYKVAKVRGVKHTDAITEGLKHVLDLNNTKQLMQFLQKGRADIAITNSSDGYAALSELGFTSIVSMEKPLAYLPLYHYVSPKHEHLAARVNEVIKEMKASGELNQLITDAEFAVLAGGL